MAEPDGDVRIPASEWEAMKTRLAQLERAIGATTVADPAAVGEVRTDRRGLLKHGALLAAGAVAGSAALVVSQAAPAAAASGDTMVLGTSMDAGTGSTDLTSSAFVATLNTANTGTIGSAIRCSIVEVSNTYPTVYAQHQGVSQAFHGLITNNASNTEPCVLAENNNSHGQAVLGTLGGQPNTSAAVQGANDTLGAGPGVLGTSILGNGMEGRVTSTGFSAGVYGSAVAGFGSGVRGDCAPGNGVYGSTKTGTAVKGVATTGRGGVFAGQAAQINLVPATAASHPTSGKSGDLFLDSTSRLWLCTVGGTTATWKQVQVA